MLVRALRIPIPLALLLAAASLPAFAAPALGNAGEPDPSFGSGGFTILDEPEAKNEGLNDVAVLPDGKILAAGGRGLSSGFLLARFNADGTPDQSFGNGGIRVLPKTAPGSPLEISAIERRADGKIVAAGSGVDSKEHTAFEFGRFSAEGVPDPEFGNGGLATVSVEPFGRAFALDEAPDGRLVAAGYTGAGIKAAVVRVRENGLADTDFNGTGVQYIDVPESVNDLGLAVKVLASGTALVGGSSEKGAFLAELDANGNPVSGFGQNGLALHDLGTRLEPSGGVEDLEVLPDGRILAAGWAEAGPNDEQLVVARFTPSGELDPSFGEGGVFRLNPTPADDEGFALAVLPDGKILVAGVRGEGLPPSFNTGDTWLVRLTPEGRLDPSFGNGGQAVASASPAKDAAFGLALQPDGRAVIAGDAFDESRKLLVGRFTADPQPAPPPRARCGKRVATIVGTPGPDRLAGTKRADVIAGGGGNDRINAGGGNDLVCAGAGKDQVKGGKGNDRVRGEAGADTLRGGPGKDLLLGEAGADRLFGGPGKRDRCNGGAGKHDGGGQGCERLEKLP